MKKHLKKVVSVVLACIFVLGMSGCGNKANTAKGEINLFIWTEYIPDSVLSDFEKETGIKVNISTFSSNEDMLSKVKSEAAGTYDIIVPSDYMVDLMAKQNLLEELNKTNIPNISNISDAYLNAYYDQGNKFSVPYLGGVATLCVNKSKVTEPITSIKQIFDSKYNNSIVVLDDTRAVIGLVAKSMGYSMNETDEAKLNEIKTNLLTLKPNIVAYDSDSPKTSMIDGTASIGYMWAAEIALAMAENPDIEVVYPEEGAYLFMDNLCIPKGSKNKEAAESFINYICKPETVKAIVEEFPYLTPNKAALDILDASYKDNPAKNPPTQAIEKGEYIKEIGDKLSIYDAMWTELKK